MVEPQELEWRPERLRCQRLASPNVIGTASPRLSWQLPAAAGGDAQVAYQVAVSTTGEADGGETGLWDSGWVESTTTSARYRGRPLESRQAAFWSVRSRTASGGTSLWSERHYFQVGLLHRSDWSASWVAHPPLGAGPQGRAAYLMRRRFHLNSGPARARAFVSERNDSGFLRLTVDERPGRKIEVRYGEILDPAGRLYRENLRGARCTDSFVCAGDGPEELAPAFAFRGWQYALVSGLSGPESLRSAQSVALTTDMKRTGWFSCSEPLLEQIYELMVCSLQANYVDVPTDCPRRPPSPDGVLRQRLLAVRTRAGGVPRARL